METLTFAGKEYVKAKSAARELGYTSDYIGQLCRAGKIDARLIGRSWSVDIEELKSHKKLRYGAKNTKHIKGRAASGIHAGETRAAGREEMRFYAHADQTMAYEADQEALLPPIQKKEEKISTVVESKETEDADYSEQKKPRAEMLDEAQEIANAEKGRRLPIIDATDTVGEEAKPDIASKNIDKIESTIPEREKANVPTQQLDESLHPPKRVDTNPDHRYIRQQQNGIHSSTTHNRPAANERVLLLPYVVTAATLAAVVLALVFGTQIEVTTTATNTDEQFGFSVLHIIEKFDSN